MPPCRSPDTHVRGAAQSHADFPRTIEVKGTKTTSDFSLLDITNNKQQRDVGRRQDERRRRSSSREAGRFEVEVALAIERSRRRPIPLPLSDGTKPFSSSGTCPRHFTRGTRRSRCPPARLRGFECTRASGFAPDFRGDATGGRFFFLLLFFITGALGRSLVIFLSHLIHNQKLTILPLLSLFSCVKQDDEAITESINVGDADAAFVLGRVRGTILRHSFNLMKPPPSPPNPPVLSTKKFPTERRKAAGALFFNNGPAREKKTSLVNPK